MPYPQFRGNAEKIPIFWYLKPRRSKLLGNVLVCSKENCPGFQQTPLDIMSGASLPIFMSKLKIFDATPTFPYNCWRPSNDNLIPASRIRRQFQHENAPSCRECNRNPLSNHIFLLTIGALAPPDCGAPTVQHPQPF